MIRIPKDVGKNQPMAKCPKQWVRMMPSFAFGMSTSFLAAFRRWMMSLWTYVLVRKL